MPLHTGLGIFERREARDVSLGARKRGRESLDGDSLATIDQDEVETEGGVVAAGEESVVNEKDEPVTWRSLPHRRQLIILTLSRLSEPLVQTSLQVRLNLNYFSLMHCRSPLYIDRHICFTNSSLSIKVSLTRRLLRKLE
jgi:hypothetical protein